MCEYGCAIKVKGMTHDITTVEDLIHEYESLKKMYESLIEDVVILEQRNMCEGNNDN